MCLCECDRQTDRQERWKRGRDVCGYTCHSKCVVKGQREEPVFSSRLAQQATSSAGPSPPGWFSLSGLTSPVKCCGLSLVLRSTPVLKGSSEKVLPKLRAHFQLLAYLKQEAPLRKWRVRGFSFLASLCWFWRLWRNLDLDVQPYVIYLESPSVYDFFLMNQHIMAFIWTWKVNFYDMWHI